MGIKLLSKTCKDDDFLKVFKELKHNQSLDLPDNNKLCFFKKRKLDASEKIKYKLYDY